MEIYAGTSGFSYKEWKGPFYPEGLPQKGMLAFYSKQLPAVEINNTFYRLPRVETLENWAAQVPEGFRFALKASRRITHMKRLKDCREETEYLLRTAQALGDHLGSILFQLPPHLRKDLPRMSAFVAGLPETPRAAIEFRHESWFDEDVFEVLNGQNIALVIADTDESPAAALPWTADWAYLRLRRSDYTPEQLAEWANRLRAGRLREAQIFFKHEEEGAGPRLAREFLEVSRQS